MREYYRRVVVTGMGMITPIGHNTEDTFNAMLNGVSGAGPLTLFPIEGHVSKVVCEVKAFDPHDYIDRREVRRRDRVQWFATIAAKQAMEQSALPITDENRERVGIYLGTGVGGMTTLLEQEHVRLETGGTRRLTPIGITKVMANGAAGLLAIDYGIWGPSMTILTACAAGNDAVGHAFHAVRRGDVDAALTGGMEAGFVSVAMGMFERSGATTQRASGTPSPFDANRDGFAVGEGAGMLVIETLENAQARGAKILGEIIGYGSSTDAYHITAPSEGGTGAARAITKALRDADIQPEDVDYVNAHGTGTPLNDKSETNAIKLALGDHASRIPISSTKSMTGHGMGATGAIESGVCLKVFETGQIPPTINYVTPDLDCDLDYVPNTARPANVKIAMNNAFGFGGHNAVLLLKRFVAS